MRLLVTGASGFVGGRLWERATAAGHEVVGVGRRRLDRPDYLSVDLGRTPSEELPALPWRPDAVVHCAARATPSSTTTAGHDPAAQGRIFRAGVIEQLQLTDLVLLRTRRRLP